MIAFATGDVLTYDRFPCNGENPWVLVIDNMAWGTSCYAIMLRGTFGGNQKPGDRVTIQGPYVFLGERRVVPPDRWPDEITALVAEMYLLGRVT